jgi:hypothetical protein
MIGFVLAPLLQTPNQVSLNYKSGIGNFNEYLWESFKFNKYGSLLTLINLEKELFLNIEKLPMLKFLNTQKNSIFRANFR